MYLLGQCGVKEVVVVEETKRWMGGVIDYLYVSRGRGGGTRVCKFWRLLIWEKVCVSPMETWLGKKIDGIARYCVSKRGCVNRGPGSGNQPRQGNDNVKATFPESADEKKLIILTFSDWGACDTLADNDSIGGDCGKLFNRFSDRIWKVPLK